MLIVRYTKKRYSLQQALVNEEGGELYTVRRSNIDDLDGVCVVRSEQRRR